MKDEALRIFEMIEQSARRRHQQVDSFLKLVSLVGPFCAANHNTVRLAMILQTVASPLVIVHGQLSRWCNDKHSRAMFWRKIGLAEHLNCRDHISESFT